MANTFADLQWPRVVLTVPDGFHGLEPGSRFEMQAREMSFTNNVELDPFGRVVGRTTVTVEMLARDLRVVPPAPAEPATWSVVDLHGTLVSRALNEASISALADLYACSAVTLLEAYRVEERDYDTGEISCALFWKMVQFLSGLPDRPALTGDATQILIDSINILPGAEQLLERLAERGPVLLATNTKREILDGLRAKFPALFERIAVVVPSYELHCRKPSNEFYLRTLLMLRDRGVGRDSHPLWIDDDPACCQASQAFGFTPIRCTSAGQALRELEAREGEPDVTAAEASPGDDAVRPEFKALVDRLKGDA